jgi:hypothetical protein
MTNMVNFDKFLPEVLPYVHDCPAFVAVNAIRNAAIEFCEKTHYWQVDASSMVVTGTTSSFVVLLPPDTNIVDVKEAFYSGRRLIPKGPDELSVMYRGMDWREAEGDPFYFTLVMPGDLRLVPSPSTESGENLSMRVAVAPTRAATEIDSDVYENCLEIIAKGARSRLNGLRGQPFYDPEMSALLRKDFMVGIGETKIKVNKGLSRASVAVAFNRF